MINTEDYEPTSGRSYGIPTAVSVIALSILVLYNVWLYIKKMNKLFL